MQLLNNQDKIFGQLERIKLISRIAIYASSIFNLLFILAISFELTGVTDFDKNETIFNIYAFIIYGAFYIFCFGFIPASILLFSLKIWANYTFSNLFFNIKRETKLILLNIFYATIAVVLGLIFSYSIFN